MTFGQGVVVIIRAGSPSQAVDMVRAVHDGGGRTIEISLSTPDALDVIAAVRRASGLGVGAGTVRTPAECSAAIAAGARFVITPVVDLAVIAMCRDAEIDVIAGAASPTEVWQAHQAGATAVKVFPAAQLAGPAYVAALTAPLPEVSLVPTGGVGIADIAAYRHAGAAAVALGGAITGPSGAAVDLPGITRRTRDALAAWSQASTTPVPA